MERPHIGHGGQETRRSPGEQRQTGAARPGRTAQGEGSPRTKIILMFFAGFLNALITYNLNNDKHFNTCSLLGTGLYGIRVFQGYKDFAKRTR